MSIQFNFYRSGFKAISLAAVATAQTKYACGSFKTGASSY